MTRNPFDFEGYEKAFDDTINRLDKCIKSDSESLDKVVRIKRQVWMRKWGSGAYMTVGKSKGTGAYHAIVVNPLRDDGKKNPLWLSGSSHRNPDIAIAMSIERFEDMKIDPQFTKKRSFVERIEEGVKGFLSGFKD